MVINHEAEIFESINYDRFLGYDYRLISNELENSPFIVMQGNIGK